MRLVASGSFAAAVAEGREARRPLLRRWGHLVGVGDVRLDNRAEVTRWSRQLSRDACDLEVVLAAVAACGPECLTQLAGDFALVLWDASTHRLVAVRDALGVRSLFYRSSPNLLVLSSSLSALSADERYDAEYIADFLVSGASTPQRTIWAGTSALPAGTILIQRGTVRSFRRYWCAADFLPEQRVDEPTAIERFRELFTDAVRCRIGDQGTWAQLSGGLDSSSIVATVQSLREDGRVAHGLAGTVTVVDALGEGDETAFSDLVVQRFQLRNEQIANHWLWQEDGRPPLTEEPRLWYPFFARDRRLYRTVADAGGSVLLSGLGADHY
ncbi:MAG: hypothetical protein HY561_10295, partial [Gemmatimonadetes bacterium]|nr:hypothetical protein [Gemmatimonadota bacterium]